MPFSRRSFLAKSSATLAGLSLGLTRSTNAFPLQSNQPVSSLFPELVEPATLQALAQGGVEAAKSAGAEYADIRISDARSLNVFQGEMIVPYSVMDFEYGYGIRVSVGGAWAFASGVDPTTDAIARAARSAVATAKGLAKISRSAAVQVAAPAVQGEWTTPVQIDPFAISGDEHTQVQGAYLDAAKRVRDSGLRNNRFTWSADTRVFASTDGSLTMQRFARVIPRVAIETRVPLKQPTSLTVQGFSSASAGFEVTLGAAHQERIKSTAEEALRLALYPEAEVEVGRYEVVMDGTALAAVLGVTLNRALELDRVLGYQADGAGTSFLGPVNDIVGQQLFSPHLTISLDRSPTSYGAAKWDDEGVATESFQPIQKGRVVDYFTTRITAPVLSDWYSKNGMTLRSRGTAVALKPALVPTGYAASQVIVEPGAQGTSLDTLISQIKNGILVRGVSPYYGAVSADYQLSGGLLLPAMMYEVKNGKITRRLLNGAIQFSTIQLWKAITVLGDANTVEDWVHQDWRGAWIDIPLAAPAARFSSLDVLSIR